MYIGQPFTGSSAELIKEFKTLKMEKVMNLDIAPELALGIYEISPAASEVVTSEVLFTLRPGEFHFLVRIWKLSWKKIR